MYYLCNTFCTTLRESTYCKSFAFVSLHRLYETYLLEELQLLHGGMRKKGEGELWGSKTSDDPGCRFNTLLLYQ